MYRTSHVPISQLATSSDEATLPLRTCLLETPSSHRLRHLVRSLLQQCLGRLEQQGGDQRTHGK